MEMKKATVIQTVNGVNLRKADAFIFGYLFLYYTAYLCWSLFKYTKSISVNRTAA